MDIHKTNMDFWNELRRRRRLFSHTRDGEPRGILQNMVGRAYILIMAAIIAAGCIALRRMPGDRVRWKSLLFVLAVSCPLGWSWQILMQKIDPEFPAWLFAPWSYLHIEFLWILEDFIFYPGCALLFYVVFRAVHFKGIPWNSPPALWSMIALYCAGTAFFLAFGSIAGRSEALMFGIPGIFFCVYARKSIDLRKFLVFQLFVVGLEAGWDWAASSFIHYIPGFAWASQWMYIAFDEAGNYTHSTVFLDYGSHSWAWLFDTPVEITPWFGIVGGIFNFGIISAADKLFYGRTARYIGPADPEPAHKGAAAA